MYLPCFYSTCRNLRDWSILTNAKWFNVNRVRCVCTGNGGEWDVRVIERKRDRYNEHRVANVRKFTIGAQDTWRRSCMHIRSELYSVVSCALRRWVFSLCDIVQPNSIVSKLFYRIVQSDVIYKNVLYWIGQRIRFATRGIVCIFALRTFFFLSRVLIHIFICVHICARAFNCFLLSERTVCVVLYILSVCVSSCNARVSCYLHNCFTFLLAHARACYFKRRRCELYKINIFVARAIHMCVFRLQDSGGNFAPARSTRVPKESEAELKDKRWWERRMLQRARVI